MSSSPETPSLAAARTERADFQASSDPALMEAADRGESQLLSYRQLYELWERQQWRSQEIGFSIDREQWQGFDERERLKRAYGLASFFLGEQHVTDELSPIVRAAPAEEMRLFLSTQLADEARHVAFFDRFYRELRILESDDLSGRILELREQVSPAHAQLFGSMLRERVDRLSAEPEDQQALVEAITLYHMVIEGTLALTGQHFIISYNERLGTLPGFVKGFTLVARDEHRHVAFGARFLREKVAEDPKYARAMARMLEVAIPLTREVLRPPYIEELEAEELDLMFEPEELQAFAARALTRRLKVIGLTSVA